VPDERVGTRFDERRPQDGVARREHAGRHDRGDRVRRVVETVEKIEKRARPIGNKMDVVMGYACLTRMDSTTLATSSQTSRTVSQSW
jgi:hypothetical protein